MSGLLLDTHAIVWLAEGSPISEKARAAISEGLIADSVFISAISYWEIIRLSARGRISIRIPSLTWFDAFLSRTGFSALPLTPACGVDAALLPDIHRDPADRFLIATARVHDLILVTCDVHIRQYAEAGLVRIIVC